MKRKQIYIGSKVRGLGTQNVIAKFAEKQKELEALGYAVFNPVANLIAYNSELIELGQTPLNDDMHRREIMGICLFHLLHSDEVLLFADWQDSEGALTEREMAMRHRMPIHYQTVPASN